MLSHVTMFGALAVGMAALALAGTNRFRASILLLVGLLPPTLLCLGRMFQLAHRATRTVDPNGWRYDLYGHLASVYRAYGTSGRLDVIASLCMICVVIGIWWRRRKIESRSPAFLFWSLVALYAVSPKAVSGAWLIHVRLLVLISVAALQLVDLGSLPRKGRAGLVALGALALSSVVVRHFQFMREVAGLDAMVSEAPAVGVHGGVSLLGLHPAWTRLPLYEHLPQWWTATWGGVGHHFFADADHQPVQSIAGLALPQILTSTTSPDLFHRFSSLLVLGMGPLPRSLSAFHETKRSGAWRRVKRTQSEE